MTLHVVSQRVRGICVIRVSSGGCRTWRSLDFNATGHGPRTAGLDYGGASVAAGRVRSWQFGVVDAPLADHGSLSLRFAPARLIWGQGRNGGRAQRGVWSRIGVFSHTGTIGGRNFTLRLALGSAQPGQAVGMLRRLR